MKSAGLLLMLALAMPCQAHNWFSVARPGAQQPGAALEVDLDTVAAMEGGGDGVIRASFEAPQAHPAGFTYRSFVATAQIDCAQQHLTLTSAAYFALPQGQGARLGVDSAGREAGMPAGLVESLAPWARQALQRAACAGQGRQGNAP